MQRPSSTPFVAFRGRLAVLAAALFTAAGAFHVNAYPLIALGVIALAALGASYLAFYPVSIFLRRRKVELAWSVPPGDQPGGALTADHLFHARLILRNYGYRSLRILGVKTYASSALEAPDLEGVLVPAGHEVELALPLRARAAGYWVLHGAQVTLGDLLGMFEVRAYFPNPIGIKVFPR